MTSTMFKYFNVHLLLTCVVILILVIVDGKPKQRKHGYSTHHYFGKLKDKTYWHQACSINPCLNGGSCTVGANRDPVCSCAFGFKGKFCDEDACSINPCLNGGNCTVGAKKEAVCSCAFGFRGIFCDEDACSTNPCLNGGNCTVGANKEPKCSCVFGFKGTFCDEDACFINPCLNGGNCTVGANKEAVCNCSFGFKGTFCNEDACSVRPCLNGGNCTLGINRDPVCSCPVGFTGTFCADLLCPPRYNRQIGTGCYIFGSYTRVEFSAIVNGCKFLGGILFEPNDQAEFAAVLKYLEDIFVTGNARSSYWIGVTDQVSEGNVVYLSSGSPFTLFDLSGTNTEDNDCVSLVKNETGTNFFPIMKTCQNTINKDGAICEYNFATGG